MRTCICLLVCALAAPVWAVKTSHWVHTTEADFKEGTFSHVVATNFGDVKLSRQVKTLLGQDARVSAVNCLAQVPDGTIYAGTGPEGILLSIKDDKVATAADLGQYKSIYSLLVDSQGRLLIGTGGEKGEILRIDKAGDKPQSVFSADGVQYVWAMAQTPDEKVYAATGPNGQLFQIEPDDTNKVLLDTDENNLLCLLSDGKDSLYVGTDPNGLVYRVNRQNGDVFVVYDAPESEISALVRDEHGNIYAATAESTEPTGPESAGAAEQVGRPESETHGVPIPSEPPQTPAPPEPPKPSPGEPLPIPKRNVSMMILAGDEPGQDDPHGGAPTTGEAMPHHAASRPGTPSSAAPEQAAATGNAIYRIDREGFVTEIFRQPVSVFAMIEQNGSLLVATGNDGSLYQVNPAAEETLVLAKVDPKDVMCLLPVKGGRVFMGLANSGDVATMTSGFASEGTYTSPVLDATQISRFGKIQLRGTLPKGTTLTVATRSGNVEEANDPGWSSWSDEAPATEFVQTHSPAARFLQYRLTFATAQSNDSPVVDEVNLAYQVPNLAPQIKSVKVGDGESMADGEEPAAKSKLTISWESSDPNEDAVEYSLYFRSGVHAPWILKRDKLKDSTYDWETRGVGDGRYEIKVQASDAAANPPGDGRTASRVSDPVIVDNTPPAIGDVKTDVAGADATISVNVADRTSTVARLEYSVDSSQDWQAVLPSDKIADSPEEAYRFVASGLSPGPHQIAVRASDSKGNRSFESINVAVEKPAAK